MGKISGKVHMHRKRHRNSLLGKDGLSLGLCMSNRVGSYVCIGYVTCVCRVCVTEDVTVVITGRSRDLDSDFDKRGGGAEGTGVETVLLHGLGDQ